MSISRSRDREFRQLVDEYVAAAAGRPDNPQRYTNAWRAILDWRDKFERTCRQAGAAGERKKARKKGGEP